MKIKLSKSKWESIGRTAGWKKTSADEESRIVTIVRDLLNKEKEYRSFRGSIPEMEEATPEDLDAGYGSEMSQQDYTASLEEPWIDIYTDQGDFVFKFHGNYEPSSVNAGRSKTVFLGELYDANKLKSVVRQLQSMKVAVYMSDAIKSLLSS